MWQLATAKFNSCERRGSAAALLWLKIVAVNAASSMHIVVLRHCRLLLLPQDLVVHRGAQEREDESACMHVERTTGNS